MTECWRKPSPPPRKSHRTTGTRPSGGKHGQTARTTKGKKGGREKRGGEDREERREERGRGEKKKQKKKREERRGERGGEGEGAAGGRGKNYLARPRLERSDVGPSRERLRIARAFSLWRVAEMRWAKERD